MAEISQTNLAAYQNKRIPEEDIRGKILREKQAATSRYSWKVSNRHFKKRTEESEV